MFCISISHMLSSSAVPLYAAAREISLPLVVAYLHQLRQQNDAFYRQRSCGPGSCSMTLGSMTECGYVDLDRVLGPQQHQESVAPTWPRFVCRELCRGGSQLHLIHWHQHSVGLTHSAETTPSSLLQQQLTDTCRMMTFFLAVEVLHHWRYYCSCSVLAGTLDTEQSPVPRPQTEDDLRTITV